mmetsp:Transcript_10273/g.21568  ORF Transcript_10273/g.21568 Transcript_10273/m.21568 type:complete len:568 (-) Transcript_10273:327-2030(-)
MLCWSVAAPLGSSTVGAGRRAGICLGEHATETQLELVRRGHARTLEAQRRRRLAAPLFCEAKSSQKLEQVSSPSSPVNEDGKVAAVDENNLDNRERLTTNEQQDGSLRSALRRVARAFKVEKDPACNRSLLILAAISCLWTLSNLMVVSILPVYMKVELGLSNAKIGTLEGAAIFAAFFSKVFSGVISDMLRSRVAVIAVGALMTALVKPAIAAAGLIKNAFGASAAFYWLFSAKITDRLSKGVRAAPVDALVADLSSSESRNRAYSLNHSAATFGGVIGSLLCSALMFATNSSYEMVFLSAAVPAVLAIVLLFSQIEQPTIHFDDEKTASASKGSSSSANGASNGASNGNGGGRNRGTFRDQIAEARTLPAQFLFSAAIVATLYLARFSETFVILRAKSVGVPTTLLPLMLTVNQLVQSVLTYPVGVVADRLSSKAVLFIGFCFLIAANLAFITLPSTAGMALGFVLIGVHLSMTQANTKSLLSAALKPTQRGIGFAVFAVISGISLAVGNILAGLLNDVSAKLGLGLIGCFCGGTVATLLSGLMLIIYYALYPSSPAAAITTKQD